jgi:hypothetical protein
VKEAEKVLSLLLDFSQPQPVALAFREPYQWRGLRGRPTLELRELL